MAAPASNWRDRRNAYLKAKAKRRDPKPAAMNGRPPREEIPGRKTAPLLTIPERDGKRNRFDDPTDGEIWRAEYRNSLTRAVVLVEAVRFRGGRNWKVRLEGQDGSRSVLRIIADHQAEFETLPEAIGQAHRRMEKWGLGQAEPWKSDGGARLSYAACLRMHLPLPAIRRTCPESRQGGA